MKTTLILLTLASLSVQTPAQPSAKIIGQPDAPLKISSYRATYVAGDEYLSEGIYHILEYKNVSQRRIIALQIGLVSFDIWNEVLDQTGGLSMKEIAPAESVTGRWAVTTSGDFSFYTGVAYVSKVRFLDGEILTSPLQWCQW
ncbi:MAG: hypothetical protein WBD36_07725 [Bacteroidota bacterium]